MQRLMVRTAFVVFLLSTKSYAQSGGVNPQADAGHASQASCVILKRMGRIDRTKSRLYSFGISGKQFRYVEGKLPEGFSSHSKMTDHDVRNLQAKGTQVLVLDSHYSSADLQEARANCRGETGRTQTQAETKAPPAPTPAPNVGTPTPASKPLTAKAAKPNAPPETPTSKAPASELLAQRTPAVDASSLKANNSASSRSITEPATSAPAPPKVPSPKTTARKTNDSASSPGTMVAALLDVSSTPNEADVYIDERFFGRTPATTIILTPGDHTLVIKKSGFAIWKRKFNLQSGRSNVDAALIPKAK